MANDARMILNVAEDDAFKSTSKNSIHFEWCLSNLKYKCQNICSPVFSLDPHGQAAWTMLLSLNIGHDLSSLTFKNQYDKPRCTINLTIDISIYKERGINLRFKLSIKPNDKNLEIKLPNIGFHARSLKIILESHLSEDHGTTCPFRDVISQPVLVHKRDFGAILRVAKFSDVTLRADDHEIKAHKAILSGRSAVFNSMFEHSMKENANKSVDISDISFETLQHFVSYLYSGTLDSEVMSVELACDLLEASDKYAVEDLLVLCSEILMNSLTPDNCLDILLLADVHSKSDLKTAAMNVFVGNCQKICENSNWEDRLMVRPSLYSELLKAMALKLKNVQ